MTGSPCRRPALGCRCGDGGADVTRQVPGHRWSIEPDAAVFAALFGVIAETGPISLSFAVRARADLPGIIATVVVAARRVPDAQVDLQYAGALRVGVRVGMPNGSSVAVQHRSDDRPVPEYNPAREGIDHL